MTMARARVRRGDGLGRVRFLRARAAKEVNFCGSSSGGRRFAAIPQGAPFLFKTHYSHGNRLWAQAS